AAIVTGVPDMIHGTPQRLAARTDDTVLVLDEHGGVLARYPIPEPLRQGEFTFSETSAGLGLMYWESPHESLRTEIEYRIFWVSPGGHARTAFATLPTASSMRPLQVLGGAVVPAPLVLGGLVGIGRPHELRDAGLATTYAEGLLRALAEFWPALAIA